MLVTVRIVSKPKIQNVSEPNPNKNAKNRTKKQKSYKKKIIKKNFTPKNRKNANIAPKLKITPRCSLSHRVQKTLRCIHPNEDDCSCLEEL